MDQNTRTYRLGEFAAVRQDAEGTPADRTYKPTMQISSTAGRTKHISVSWGEFERIAALLTGGIVGRPSGRAALIAAAPDMLHVLQMIQADGVATSHELAIRAAIARATNTGDTTK